MVRKGDAATEAGSEVDWDVVYRGAASAVTIWAIFVLCFFAVWFVVEAVSAQSGIDWTETLVDTVDSGVGAMVDHVQVNSTLFACENTGAVVKYWKSADLGATWGASSTVFSGNGPRFCAIDARTENHTVIAFRDGATTSTRVLKVARTTDGGASWSTVTADAAITDGNVGSTPSVAYAGVGVVLAVNAAVTLDEADELRFCKSVDNGATFDCDQVDDLTTGDELCSLTADTGVFAASATEYVVVAQCAWRAANPGASGSIARWRSTDAGATFSFTGVASCVYEYYLVLPGEVDPRGECVQELDEYGAFAGVGGSQYALFVLRMNPPDGQCGGTSCTTAQPRVYYASGAGNWSLVGVADSKVVGINDGGDWLGIAPLPTGGLGFFDWEWDEPDVQQLEFNYSLDGGTTFAEEDLIDAVNLPCTATDVQGCASVIGLADGSYSLFVGAATDHIHYRSGVVSVANFTRCCFELGRAVAFGFDTEAKSLHVQDHENLYRFDVDTPGYPDDVDTLVVTEMAVGNNCEGNPLMDETGQTFAGPSINALAVTSEGANVGRAIAMCNNLGSGAPDYVVLYDQALEGDVAWAVESNPNSVGFIDARTANDVIYAGPNLPESALGWLVSLDLPALEKDWEVDTQEQIVEVAFDLLRADEVWITTDEGTRMYRVATGLKGYSSPDHALSQLAVGNRTVYLNDVGGEAVIRQYTFNGAALVAGSTIDTGFDTIADMKASKDGEYVMAWDDGNTFKLFNKTGLEPLLVGHTATQIVDLDMDLVNRYLAALDQDILYVYNVFQHTTSGGGEGNGSFNLPPGCIDNEFCNDESVDPGPVDEEVGGVEGWFGATTLDAAGGMVGASRGEVAGWLAVFFIVLGASLAWRFTRSGIVAAGGGFCGLVFSVLASLAVEWMIAVVSLGAIAFIVFKGRG